MLSNNPRLWYSGGEGRGQDPRSQTEDLSDNSMKASDYGMKNLKRVMEKIYVYAPVVDGQYKDLSDFHRAVRQQYERYVGHVARNIAGRFENSLPTQTPYGYVPKARQKEAIDWIGRNIYNPPMWLFPEDISNKTGFDAETDIITRQSSVLSEELSLTTLSNIFKQNVYPVNDYLDDVFNTVWQPLKDNNEKQNQFRRQLERCYVNLMAKMINPKEDSSRSDATSMLRQLLNPKVNPSETDVFLYILAHLDKIEDYAKSQVTSDHKSINALHYKDILQRVKKIRDEYNKADK